MSSSSVALAQRSPPYEVCRSKRKETCHAKRRTRVVLPLPVAVLAQQIAAQANAETLFSRDCFKLGCLDVIGEVMCEVTGAVFVPTSDQSHSTNLNFNFNSGICFMKELGKIFIENLFCIPNPNLNLTRTRTVNQALAPNP